jgi:hypothetical protein
MGRKTLAMVLCGFWLWVPGTAAACDLYLAYTHMMVPSGSFSLGAGVNSAPLNGDGDTYTIPSVDFGIRLGDRAAVHPAVGMCRGGGESEIVFGGGGTLRLFTNPAGNLGINLQTHVGRASFGDFTETTIPVLGSVSYQVNPDVSLFGNAGVQLYRWSYDGEGADVSDTETNPAASAGVRYSLGSFVVSAGLNVVKWEDDTNLGLMAGMSIPLR